MTEALEIANGKNHDNDGGGYGHLVFKNINSSSFNINGNSDDLFVVKQNSNDANINLGGGNNTVIFETNPGKNVNVNVQGGHDVLVLPGNKSDYNFNSLNENNGVLVVK